MESEEPVHIRSSQISPSSPTNDDQFYIHPKPPDDKYAIDEEGSADSDQYQAVSHVNGNGGLLSDQEMEEPQKSTGSETTNFVGSEPSEPAVPSDRDGDQSNAPDQRETEAQETAADPDEVEEPYEKVSDGEEAHITASHGEGPHSPSGESSADKNVTETAEEEQPKPGAASETADGSDDEESEKGSSGSDEDSDGADGAHNDGTAHQEAESEPGSNDSNNDSNSEAAKSSAEVSQDVDPQQTTGPQSEDADSCAEEDGGDEKEGDAGDEKEEEDGGDEKMEGDAGDEKEEEDGGDEKMEGDAGDEKEEEHGGDEKMKGDVGDEKEEEDGGDEKMEGDAGDEKEEEHGGDEKMEGDVGDEKEEEDAGDEKEDGGDGKLEEEGNDEKAEKDGSVEKTVDNDSVRKTGEGDGDEKTEDVGSDGKTEEDGGDGKTAVDAGDEKIENDGSDEMMEEDGSVEKTEEDGSDEKMQEVDVPEKMETDDHEMEETEQQKPADAVTDDDGKDAGIEDAGAEDEPHQEDASTESAADTGSTHPDGGGEDTSESIPQSLEEAPRETAGDDTDGHAQDGDEGESDAAGDVKTAADDETAPEMMECDDAAECLGDSQEVKDLDEQAPVASVEEADERDIEGTSAEDVTEETSTIESADDLDETMEFDDEKTSKATDGSTSDSFASTDSYIRFLLLDIIDRAVGGKGIIGEAAGDEGTEKMFDDEDTKNISNQSISDILSGLDEKVEDVVKITTFHDGTDDEADDIDDDKPVRDHWQEVQQLDDLDPKHRAVKVIGYVKSTGEESKELICNYCAQSYPSQGELFQHAQETHTLKCPETDCKYHDFTYSAIMAHCQKKHSLCLEPAPQPILITDKQWRPVPDPGEIPIKDYGVTVKEKNIPYDAFVCTYCEKAFRNSYYIFRHMRKQHPGEDVMVKVIDYNKSSRDDSSDDKSSISDFCLGEEQASIIGTHRKLNNALLLQYSNKLIVSMAKRIPNELKDLSQYYRILNSGEYRCRSCIYKQEEKKHMENHVLIHLSVTVFKCPHCTYGTNTRKTGIVHLIKYHPGKECVLICRKPYKNKPRGKVVGKNIRQFPRASPGLEKKCSPVKVKLDDIGTKLKKERVEGIRVNLQPVMRAKASPQQTNRAAKKISPAKVVTRKPIVARTTKPAAVVSRATRPAAAVTRTTKPAAVIARPTKPTPVVTKPVAKPITKSTKPAPKPVDESSVDDDYIESGDPICVPSQVCDGDVVIEWLPKINKAWKMDVSPFVRGVGNHSTCLKCGYVSNNSHVAEHVRVQHFGAEYWICPYCNLNKARQKELEKHVLDAHPGEQLRIYRGKPFKRHRARSPTKAISGVATPKIELPEVPTGVGRGRGRGRGRNVGRSPAAAVSSEPEVEHSAVSPAREAGRPVGRRSGIPIPAVDNIKQAESSRKKRSFDKVLSETSSTPLPKRTRASIGSYAETVGQDDGIDDGVSPRRVSRRMPTSDVQPKPIGRATRTAEVASDSAKHSNPTDRFTSVKLKTPVTSTKNTVAKKRTAAARPPSTPSRSSSSSPVIVAEDPPEVMERIYACPICTRQDKRKDFIISHCQAVHRNVVVDPDSIPEFEYQASETFKIKV